METKEKQEISWAGTSSSDFFRRGELDSIIRDVLRQWWVILITAVAFALIAGTYLKVTYVPKYTTSVTFLVSSSGVSSNTVSDNLTAASALTDNFTTIADSDILSSRVARALGLSSLDAEISVSTVSSTNLMTLTVTASTSRMAYMVIESVMEVASELCAELSDNIAIKVLQEPSVPMSKSNPLSLRSTMIRAALVGAALMIVVFAAFSYFRDGSRANMISAERWMQSFLEAFSMSANIKPFSR
ncbi:MAG: Wzz/FepE/Etk N-terminal domain-containing protein [Lachnospiraceae bacterium]|nr:Wzz/FepE/Etk N-terminal domain-containing protein [Lachnospiraceae bacterium]